MTDIRIPLEGCAFFLLENVGANDEVIAPDDPVEWVADNLIQDVSAVTATVREQWVTVEQADIHERIRNGFETGIQYKPDDTEDESDPGSIATIEMALDWTVFRDAAIQKVQDGIDRARDNEEDLETEDVLDAVEQAIRCAVETNMRGRMF